MASNNKFATSRHVDSETFCATGGVGRNQSTHSDTEKFNVNRVGRHSAKDEPKLPKGYRHIRSAIEAVLECSGEHLSG